MHFKLGLLSALAVTASASSPTTSYQQLGQNLVNVNEYVVRNLDEVCFSKIPIPTCNENSVVVNSKVMQVEFYCTNKSDPRTQIWIEKIEKKKIISDFDFESVHVRGQVEVPIRCVAKAKVSLEDQARRIYEQQRSERVQLVDESNQTYVQDQYEIDKYSLKEGRDKYNENQAKWQNYDLSASYPHLHNHRKKDLAHFINLSENDFEHFYSQLSKFVSSEQINKQLTPEVQNFLPNVFSQVAKKLYTIWQTADHHAHKQDVSENWPYSHEFHSYFNTNIYDYEKYKHHLKRVYSYIVKEVIVLNQAYPTCLKHTSDYVRTIWQNLQKQLTKKQIEQIEQVVTFVEQTSTLDQTLLEMSDELVDDDKWKYVHQSTRRNLLRIILTGLRWSRNNKI